MLSKLKINKIMAEISMKAKVDDQLMETEVYTVVLLFMTAAKLQVA